MVAAVTFFLPLLGCGSNQGVSAAEVEQAAKERVRQSLGLTEESVLFSKVFVGKPVDGETVICGTVEGKRADGSSIQPRRFILATGSARWLKFGTVDDNVLPSRPDKFIEWHTTCTGQEEIR